MARRTPDPLDDALLTPTEVARKYKVTVRTMKARLKKGTWRRAMPCMADPLRWRREQVERDIQTSKYADDLHRLGMV